MYAGRFSSSGTVILADIVITTLNARYWHTAFGLRYLLANMGEMRNRTGMLEFGINDQPVEVVAEILRHRPRIVGIGVYIWNVEQVRRIAESLKRVSPEILLVLGGPEISYETESQPLVKMADYVVCGEADIAFPQLCRELLAGDEPAEQVIAAPTPSLEQVAMPYELYSDEDIAQRVIYVEVSRGCPFTCEFCLSALDIPVRMFGLEPFLDSMQRLLDRGARTFKFVDRTFNLNLRVGSAILEFFLERYEPGLFLHFEMIPDRLPDALRALIVQFPEGSLQFEIGVQTFNDEIGVLIGRRQNNEKLAENFRFLRDETGVHVHADLIVGLPGEDVESFGRGFDRLIELGPQEIQVGMLKRLKGTPIVRHDDEFEMVYESHPPFTVLRTRDVDFETMMRLRHFARAWDLVGNSGNFVESHTLLWFDGASPFERFLEFTDWLVLREQRLVGISLVRLSESLFQFLTGVLDVLEDLAAAAIWRDYTRSGRHDKPAFLRGFDLPAANRNPQSDERLLPRQRRHKA